MSINSIGEFWLKLKNRQLKTLIGDRKSPTAIFNFLRDRDEEEGGGSGMGFGDFYRAKVTFIWDTELFRRYLVGKIDESFLCPYQLNTKSRVVSIDNISVWMSYWSNINQHHTDLKMQINPIQCFHDTKDLNCLNAINLDKIYNENTYNTLWFINEIKQSTKEEDYGDFIDPQDVVILEIQK